MTSVIRLRKSLDARDAAPVQWPPAFRPAPLGATEPVLLHRLLEESYRNGFGSVPPLEQWWPGTISDEEFDPELLFVALTNDGDLAGMALCWTSGFVKDIAVAEQHRGKGVGAALLRTAFAAFQRRGAAHVELKVMAGNEPALQLYRHLGMTEAPL